MGTFTPEKRKLFRQLHRNFCVKKPCVPLNLKIAVLLWNTVIFAPHMPNFQSVHLWSNMVIFNTKLNRCESIDFFPGSRLLTLSRAKMEAVRVTRQECVTSCTWVSSGEVYKPYVSRLLSPASSREWFTLKHRLPSPPMINGRKVASRWIRRGCFTVTPEIWLVHTHRPSTLTWN